MEVLTGGYKMKVPEDILTNQWLRMDLEEVKACLRGLLSSSALSYNLKGLLIDFKNLTGLDLPIFGYLHPVEFLRTLDDTVQLFGNPYNPEIALVQSNKSAHITSLVDRQKTASNKKKKPVVLSTQKRLIVPDKKFTEKENNCLFSQPPQLKYSNETKPSQIPSVSNSPRHVPQTHIKCDLAKQTVKIPAEAKPKPASTLKCPEATGQVEKSNGQTFYLEDISDTESCFSDDDFRSDGAVASNSCFVNEGIKNKLKKLIKNHPKGLWCCELPRLFEKEYNFALDFREYGCTSLIQMLSELPDVFRCVRPGSEDWLLFDASVAPSPEEMKLMDLHAAADISHEVSSNIKKLLCKCFENSSDPIIDLDVILVTYKNVFGRCLDVHSLGFKDLKSLLKTWEGNWFNLMDFCGKTYLVPIKITPESTVHWEEALPPITADNDIFVEIFPKAVVGPDESLLELDLARHVAVDNVIKVSIGEVWSPSRFYLQLHKFSNHLNFFMEDLQRFYNVHLNKYKMPDSTIRPKQICVGLYTSDPDTPEEWHRAQIIKVINEKTVLVNFLDFGTETRIKKSHLRFLHRSFQSFPVQGFLAQLSGVVPANGESKWPISTCKRFLELVQVACLDAEIVDIDFKKPSMSVILFDPSQKPGCSINKKLVHEKLAQWEEPASFRIVKEQPKSGWEEPKPAEKQMKEPFDKTSGRCVQEKFIKIVPEIKDEFSDIIDLGQPTFLHFKMKCLKVESSEPAKTKGEEKVSLENMKYLFDDVPDLDVKVGEKPGEKESIVPEEEKPPTFGPPLPERLCSPSPLLLSTVSPDPSQHPEGESNAYIPQPNDAVESNFSSFPGKPKRLPPGLEHANVSPKEMVATDDLRKKINILAMEFFMTNSSIKQVGVNDPALAMKIATEMAEACITCSYKDLSLGFNQPMVQPQPDVAIVKEPEVPILPSERPSEPMETARSVSPKPRSQPSPAKEENGSKYIREIQIAGKTLHLVTVDTKLYFCAEEIVQTFTLFSSRDIADRLLQIKKIQIDYKIISKGTHQEILKAIKNKFQAPKKKSKKTKIYLIEIGKVVPFLQGLGCVTASIDKDFKELLSTEGKQTDLQNPDAR